MSLALRRLLFLAFVLAFLVTAPLVVLYTAGYRINKTTGRIQQTGVIAVSTSPRSADIALNSEPLDNRTPYVLQRLMPGTYDLHLSKRGYFDWEQNVTVESGRTTYVSALLLADATPELLLEESASSFIVTEDGRSVATLVLGSEDATVGEVWIYDIPTRTQRLLAELVLEETVPTLTWSANEDAVLLRVNSETTNAYSVTDGSALAEDRWPAFEDKLPEFDLYDNGTNVEIRRVHDGGSTLAGVLPLSTYTVVYRDNSVALLRDTRERTYSLNLSSGAATQLDIPSTMVDWNEETQLLLASDGSEIDIVNLATGEKTFVTRQSEPLVAVAWHPAGNAIIAATSDSVSVIEVERYESRQVTTLIDNVSVTTMWPDLAGRTIYFSGTIDGISGIYRIKLVK